ncbi:MAG: hypothetical protein Q9170_004211 [Blastenia crenularia]
MPIQSTFRHREGHDREARGLQHTPMSSNSDDFDTDDFEMVDENSLEAEWDGDQTKYHRPTTYQSLKQSAEYALRDVRTEGLTKENLVKHTGRLGKEVGGVVVEAVKGYVGGKISGATGGEVCTASVRTSFVKKGAVEAVAKGNEEGSRWMREDVRFDPLVVSDEWKRSAEGGNEDAGHDSNDKIDEINLGPTLWEDPREVEDLLPGDEFRSLPHRFHEQRGS